MATEQLERWIEARTEPAWLGERRRAAAALDAATVLPHWDRTDARGLDGAALAPAGGSVTIVLPPGAEKAGVVCGPLEVLAASHPDVVRRYLGAVVADDAGKFESRNAAAHQGCLLFVPDRVVLDGPVEVVYRLDAAPGSQLHPRTVIGLGRMAEAVVIQRQEGGPEAPDQASVTAVVEADLDSGSQLRFVDLQDWASGVRAFATREARLGRDARVHWLIGELGAGLLRSATTTWLQGAGSEAQALLAFFASGSQHMDVGLTLRHHGERTDGQMLTKGVLAGRSRAIYRGTSDIERGARDSNSQQRENVLHLDSGVRSDAIPALFINENQLQAGHAATTGKVDEEQMFYMASRGLPAREAQRLIVHGFFAPLLERVPLQSVRERIDALIDRKIDAG